MSGFSPKSAEAAVAAGWKKAEVVEAHLAAEKLGLGVTRTFSWGALLDERWLLYRGLWCLPDLELARSPLLPEKSASGETVVYADGSGTGKRSPSGSGVVVYEPGRPPRYVSENEGPGTNNWAELLAVWRALKAVPDTRRALLVCTDSQYAIGAMEERSWTLVANVALIGAIREDLDLRRSLGQKIDFRHVDGHSGIEGNEAADRLASMARTVVSRSEPVPGELVPL